VTLSPNSNAPDTPLTSPAAACATISSASKPRTTMSPPAPGPRRSSASFPASPTSPANRSVSCASWSTTNRSRHLPPGRPLQGWPPSRKRPLCHCRGRRAAPRLHHQRPLLRPRYRPPHRLCRGRGRSPRQNHPRHRHARGPLRRGPPSPPARHPFCRAIPLQDRADNMGGDPR